MVAVSNEKPVVGISMPFSLARAYHPCGQYKGVPAAGKDVEVTCKKAVIGRYLYIYVPQISNMQLCEVQVFGKDTGKKTPGKENEENKYNG